MDFKLLGSVLLIVGTSIGAGMLALPIATAQLGFFGSLLLLIGCWFVMTAGALLLLEVNLWLPLNSNLISMARATIGPFGQFIAWVTYLLLLYSLLCAYIAGGSDLFQNVLTSVNLNVSDTVSVILFTFVFGAIVYLGIKSVDYVNRVLMLIKFSAFFLLLFLLVPLISGKNITYTHFKDLTSLTAITVTITSFGYAAIVPSLRMYFGDDIPRLKKAIFIGSLIPLFCYIAWDAAIMGVLPLDGPHGLNTILNSTNTTSDLVNSLISVSNENTVTFFAKLFTSICVLTSFLGVSLCIIDFLADGFHLQKDGPSNLMLHILTYIPPLFIVSYYPGIFVSALKYAGIYCVVLLILLPAWMVWQGRYKLKIAESFKVPGGRGLLLIMIVFSLVMIVCSIAVAIQSVLHP